MRAENATSTHHVGIVGVGPRGLSVLERIVENAREHTQDTLTVHVAECREFGSGDVWRTGQSSLLLMNAVAGQITAFTDETVRMGGPARPGPNLYEWARMLAHDEVEGTYPPEVVEEAARTHPNSFCRRLFYGHYLEWTYRQLVQGCPSHVQISEHRGTVVSVTDEESGLQTITLEGGEVFSVHDVVLALGHATVRPSETEIGHRRFAERIGGLFYPPANPADVENIAVEPSATVLIRGLGLCFHDYVSLLTEGRGGRFVDTDAGLVYVASGDEPRIVCGSRRGLPLHSRAENEKGDERHEPMFFTEAAIGNLRAHSPGGLLDFRRDCWPLIAKEVETAYYTRLVALRVSEDRAAEFCHEYASADWSSDDERRLVRRAGIGAELDWNWSRIFQPWTEDHVSSQTAWREFVGSYLTRDLREARLGNITSPLKSAVDVIRDVRNEIRYVVNHGGVEADSYRRDIEGWFNSLHSFVSIGPPLSRIEELMALMDAGLVRIAGPQFSVYSDPAGGVFAGQSLVPDDGCEARAFIDATLPKVDLARTNNTVLSRLRKSRQVTTFSIRSASSGEHRTGGVAVTKRPYRAIRENGTVHSRRFVLGVPTEGANWVTETTIRGNVDSVTLGDTDAIAREVLGLAETVPTTSIA